VEKAEVVLTKALNLSSTNEVALYNIASLFHKHKGDLQASGNALYRLTKLNGNHTGALQQLGRVLIDTFKQRPILSEEEEESAGERPNLREAMDYYEKAIALVSDPSNIIIEYLNSINEHGDVREKVRAYIYIYVYICINIYIYIYVYIYIYI
jgi:tetratricopeptide (TPR) repeat protein